jgi:hypothetical protein
MFDNPSDPDNLLPEVAGLFFFTAVPTVVGVIV